MARKNVIAPYLVFQEEDMSVSFTQSEPTVSLYQDNVSYQVVWNGASPVGEYFIEGTNYDLDDPEFTPIWTPLDFGLPMLVTGNTGDDLVNINQCPFNALRFRYAADGGAPGTGQMMVVLVSKPLGG